MKPFFLGDKHAADAFAMPQGKPADDFARSVDLSHCVMESYLSGRKTKTYLA